MNLMNDFAFKRVFGEPDGSRGLVALLNAVIHPADPMTAVRFENSEIPPESALAKTVRLDITVRSDRDQTVDIEMQAAPQRTMRERTLLYWSRLFEKQARRGQGYGVLRPCIAIQFLNFTSIRSTTAFHTSYHVTEDRLGFRLTQGLEIHLVELPKFRTSVNDVASTARDHLGKWLLMLNATEQAGWVEALEEAASTDRVLQETLAVWEAASMDDATWKRYIDRDLILRDIYQYRQEGFEDGVKEGEHAKAIAIARGMLAKGLAVSLVAEVTGLRRSAIESLGPAPTGEPT